MVHKPKAGAKQSDLWTVQNLNWDPNFAALAHAYCSVFLKPETAQECAEGPRFLEKVTFITLLT